jgi:diadenosine tetraphosphate (Ap4A) HIT family hydrolase
VSNHIMSAKMDCLFCKIVAGVIPCFKLAESSKALAFLDVNPLSAGHSLVIPKAHYAKFHEMSPDDASDLLPLALEVAKAFNSETGIDYNILQNNGAAAHQVINHVHFHIIPKTKTNGLTMEWNSRTADKEELAKLQANIVSKLSK